MGNLNTVPSGIRWVVCPILDLKCNNSEKFKLNIRNICERYIKRNSYESETANTIYKFIHNKLLKAIDIERHVRGSRPIIMVPSVSCLRDKGIRPILLVELSGILIERLYNTGLNSRAEKMLMYLYNAEIIKYGLSEPDIRICRVISLSDLYEVVAKYACPDSTYLTELDDDGASLDL